MTLIGWARGAYLAGVALAVLLFLPQAWFPLLLGKVAVAAVLFALSAVLWTIAVFRGEESVPRAAWVVVLLPIAYLLSWAFSTDQALGIMTSGFDADTVMFAVLAFVAAALGAALFRTTQQAWLMLRVLFIALVVAAAFQCVAVFAGVPFADRSTNLIGKWNDFAIILSLLSLLLLIELEFGGLAKRWWALLAVVGVAVLVLLSTVNFTLAWALLLACALLSGAGRWLMERRVPWASAACVVVAVAFLVFGTALNTQVTKVLPVSSLEVRPSWQSTVDVVAAAHGASVKNAALGTGPNTFGNAWLLYKPAGVNQSQFWNLDFTVGFSTLATAFETAGLVGVLAWLVPLFLVLAGAWRARSLRGSERVAALGLIAGSILLWVALALYVPSVNVVLLAFVLVGVLAGFVWQGSTRGGVLLSRAVALVVVLLAFWSAFVGARELVAASLSNEAVLALQAGDADQALAFDTQSQSIERTPDNLRTAVDAGAAKLQALAQAPATADSQAQFTSMLQTTIASAQAAMAADPEDYRPYVSIGQVYEFLAQNKVAGAYDKAKAAYQAAATRDPSDPSVPLALARLEAEAGSSTQALQDALKRSLTLKPDYTDAILFVVQLDIAQNDLASAVRDTQTAINTAPGVPSLWFELGLLYYAGGDTKDAISPLEQAIVLEPGYANAQYYLGLSYDAQGRARDALPLFVSLAQTNPDNAAVKGILANLEAGRPALTGLSTTTPTTTAPVQ